MHGFRNFRGSLKVAQKVMQKSIVALVLAIDLVIISMSRGLTTLAFTAEFESETCGDNPRLSSSRLSISQLVLSFLNIFSQIAKNWQMSQIKIESETISKLCRR